MKKFLTLRVPVWLVIFLIIGFGIFLLRPEVRGVIGDIWDVGPWRITSAGDLIPSVTGTYTIGNATYKVKSANISGDLTVGGAFIVVVSSTSSTYTAPTVTGTVVVRSDNWKVYVCTGTTPGPWWVVVGGQS